MVAAGLDGVGSRAVGRERELEPRGLCHLRDDNRLRRNGPQGEQGERRGTVDAAVLAFVDLFGIGGGARTTGAAGVDGVGFGFVDRDRELDPRCLGHLRDCDRLARKGAAFKRGGGSRPLRVCRRLRHRRREHDASRWGDGVGCRDVGGERKQHPRGLLHLRDGDRLGRNGMLRRVG